ncbi:RNA polymerase, sigma-24 subunit, ECF subfamily [Syntrophobotulus glycolicus DSM 8271]|uniref:RNA polymerase, sigma-24 subunit, ECF subfamily n=1 Tax=Syntrophobotulus glycolicus (strain DSM 8271 / FlGlyR) TaxID=645991 RepID=F0SWI8_SYNGF|nr:RNA polymerase sigma factor [Syntrophobotulus glycolicus]ADY55754.1 RNA polymerase, sigma-24 subunit, ECF subfamily [Syntrophobotulus glycolicus DSM 8271]
MLIYLALIETEEEKRKFERLYLEYKQTMYYAAYRILKNVHNSEDAVHQAFLRVISNLDKINEADCHKTQAFLVVITEHIAIDIYRKQKRENTLSYDELEIYIADMSSQSNEDTNDVINAIAKLSVNYSTVLRLKFSQGYTDTEIAQILDITEENVRQRISRAKKKLSQLLEKEGESE